MPATPVIGVPRVITATVGTLDVPAHVTLVIVIAALFAGVVAPVSAIVYVFPV